MSNEPQDQDYDVEDHYGEIPYGPRESVKPWDLHGALCGLCLLNDDPFLRMQAFNVDIVDQFVTDLEYRVLRELIAEDVTPKDTPFLNAQSQMWIFAIYELIRTWKERAGEILKWAKNGGLEAKLSHLQSQQEDFLHFGREVRMSQIKAVLDDPSLVAKLECHLQHIYIPFSRLEYIRVSLAKHQLSGKQKSIALYPAYGRINNWCGSLDYAIENGPIHLGQISRRDVADTFRLLRLDDEPPSQDDLSSFDEFMATKLPDTPL